MMLFILIFHIFMVSLSQGQVYIGFPFNEQLPNVARINEPYSFTLANITYKSSNNAPITYTATNLPTWLYFDGNSRTFTGTPSVNDVSEFEITLSGTDTSDNSIISNNYSMIVSNDTGLHLSSPNIMFTQIAQYGQTNGADGLVVSQGQTINIKFDQSVFESYPNSNRPIIAYYGRSADRSSLPPWIEFNSNDLSFSGTVPYVVSDIAPSYEYSFAFIGSDYYGYAGAAGIFNIIIGAHQLSTSLNDTIKINGTYNGQFEINIPIFTDVYLDGTQITQGNISSVYPENLPDFIQFDNQKYTLSGTFPDSETFDNFTIIVEDIYQNTVQLPYSFDAINSVFTMNNLPNVNATRGKFFEYQILQSDFTNFQNTNVSVNFDSTNWLTFTQSNLTFTGQTPNDFNNLQVNVNAQSNFGNESKSFNIIGVDKLETTSSSSSVSSSSTSSSSHTSSQTTSTSSATSTATTTATTNSDKSKSKSSTNKKALIIGLAAGIPGFIALVAAIFLFCCCLKRRKNKKNTDNEKGTIPPSSPELSGPGFGTTINKANKYDQEDEDDEEEDAKQLSSLNALKLDNFDAESTSSSLTQVDSNDSKYVDANDKPIKSWRAKDGSDNKNPFRKSDASLSTVNTEQLFSVRLVDDGSYRYSQGSLLSPNYMSNNSLNGLLTRDTSGNIQRLDSDGNIVESNHSTSPKKEKGMSRDTSNLDILVEENSRDYSNNTIYHSAKNENEDEDHHHHQLGPDDTEGTISHLLNKFTINSHSNSGSENDISQYNNDIDDDTDNENENDHNHDSYLNGFKATKDSNGEFKWTTNTSRTNLITPTSDKFDTNDTPTTKVNPSPMNHSNHSNYSGLSLHSNNSEQFLINNNNPNNNSKGGSNITLKATSPAKVKLVEFTRKGSLRESAYEPDYNFREQRGQIHNNDSD
ncbi:polarity establishment/cellular polarization [Scheffersomyces amazonensis]|uniref:polarity establishment/cellular polarization n=1 Tax=Scheffersomyces amazonensis TaxID=1078765 RepID=UPI00315D4B1B